MRLYKVQPYEAVLQNIRLHYWTEDTEQEIVHFIRTCKCDKCKHIKELRVKQRKEYMASRREFDNVNLRAYMNRRRLEAVAKGRPKNTSLAWCGLPWIDEDYEFYMKVKSFATRKGYTVSELVKASLERAMKKENCS